MAGLLHSSASAQSRMETTRFATVTMAPEEAAVNPARADEVFNQTVALIDEAFLALCNYFGPMEPYPCDDERYNIPIEVTAYVDSGPDNPTGRTRDGVWVTETSGLKMGFVHATTIGGEVNVRSTLSHELMHVILHSYLGYPSQENHWMLEGVGDMMEYVVWEDGPRMMSRFQNYIKTAIDSNGDSGHNTPFLDSGNPYQNSLFFYYVWQTRNQRNLLKNLIRGHENGVRDEFLVRHLALETFWDDYTRRVFNFNIPDAIRIDGDVVRSSDNNLEIWPPVWDEPKWTTGVRPYEVPGMAWDGKLFKVSTGTNVEFRMTGDLTRNDVSVHAFVHFLDGAGRDEWIHRSWNGQDRAMLCQVESEACPASNVDGDIAQVYVMVANAHPVDPVSGGVEMFPEWPDRFRATAIQVAADRTVPIRGELTFDFSEDDWITISSEDWWLPIDLDLMYGDNAILFDQIITDMINRNCTFTGRVEFSIEEQALGEADADGRQIMSMVARRRGPNRFHPTPEHIRCPRPSNAEIQQQYPDAPMIPLFLDRVDELFSSLNTLEIAEDSNLNTFVNIMGGTMLMMIDDDATGTVHFAVDPNLELPNGSYFYALGDTGMKVFLTPITEDE